LSSATTHKPWRRRRRQQCLFSIAQTTGLEDRGSWRTAARQIRSRPGSSGARFASFVSMMRMPTAPGVFFQSAITFGHRRVVWVDRLDDREPVGMRLLHLHRLALRESGIRGGNGRNARALARKDARPPHIVMKRHGRAFYCPRPGFWRAA